MEDREMMQKFYAAGVLYGLATALGVDADVLQAFEQDPAENAQAVAGIVVNRTGWDYLNLPVPTAQEMRGASDALRALYQKGVEDATALIRFMLELRILL